MQQLTTRIGEVTTMYSLGARPMQIFASQIGQITQGTQIASAGTGKFAALMGGPWTIAMNMAAIVLLPLRSNLLDSGEAREKAKKRTEERSVGKERLRTGK